MQPEKKFLVDEVGAYLDKSDYVFLADFQRVTVAETELIKKRRKELNLPEFKMDCMDDLEKIFASKRSVS